MSIRSILAGLAGLLTLTVAAAPLPEHVQWDARVDSMAPDRANIVLTATMAEGWHIYGFTKPTEDA